MFEHTAVTARIGLLAPTSNAVMEVEFYRSLPADITVHTTRIPRAGTAVDADSMTEMIGNAAQAAAALVQAQPALMVYGHTASSYLDGPEGDARIARRVSDAAGVPAITTAGSVVRCLQAIGARRIALAAPYPQAITQTGATFLRAAGFDVCAVECLGVDQGPDLKHVPLQRTYDLCIRAAADTDADALFMSGTGVRTREAIGPLERALGRPVITANLAALWGALDHLGRTADFAFGESRLRDWLRRGG